MAIIAMAILFFGMLICSEQSALKRTAKKITRHFYTAPWELVAAGVVGAILIHNHMSVFILRQAWV